MKYRFLCLVIYLLIPPVISTVVCEECRPLDLQTGPGIGIELALDYGTASIKYRNGTFVDVAKITGSPDYISAMKTLAEDAEAVLSGHTSSLPKVFYNRPPKPATLLPIFPSLTTHNLYRYAIEHFQAIPIFRPAPVTSSDPQVAGLTQMLLSLKNSISAAQELKYPFIFLAIPDSIQLSSYTACNRFELAAHQAGLELVWTCKALSKSALSYHYIESCFGEPMDSCGADVKMPLTISYTNSSLAASIYRRDDDMLEVSRQVLELELGAEAASKKEDASIYWASVKAFVEDVVGDEKVDALFLLGENNKNIRLRDVIDEILAERGLGKNVDQLMGDFGKDMGDGLWFGARGAAVVARRFM